MDVLAMRACACSHDELQVLRGQDSNKVCPGTNDLALTLEVRVHISFHRLYALHSEGLRPHALRHGL